MFWRTVGGLPKSLHIHVTPVSVMLQVCVLQVCVIHFACRPVAAWIRQKANDLPNIIRLTFEATFTSDGLLSATTKMKMQMWKHSIL